MADDDLNVTPRDSYWMSVIDAHKTKGKAERTEWGELARMYRGGNMPIMGEERNGLVEDDGTKVPSSYVYAFCDTLAANVVPTNPAVTIKTNRKALDDAARFRTQLANLIMRKERIGEKLWGMTTRAGLWGRCWMKAAWSKDAERPTYRVVDPHYVWADLDADCEEDMQYVIEVVTLTQEQFESRIKTKGSRKKQFYPARLAEKVEFGEFPDWVEPETSETGTTSGVGEDVARKVSKYCVIYEIYDFIEKKFYHYAEGVPEPLFTDELPYTFAKNPWKLLTFNDNVADLGGMGDASLIKQQVKRLEELDSLEMLHIKTAIPSLVLHEGLVEDIESLMDAIEQADGPGLVIPFAANPGVGIDQVMGQTPTVQLPIEWARSRANVEENIEFTVGLPSYQRGEVGQADVATELALADTATRTRNARRQKVVYGVIEWVAKTTIGLYHQFMRPDSELPIRIADNLDETTVTGSMLGFSDEDDVWSWDYTAHPYTAAEQNEIVQLKQLETFLPILVGNPAVDQTKLVKHLLDLLHAPDLMAEQQGAPMQPPPMGPGGGMEGAAPGMPPEMQPMAQGGEVMQGAGAQAVPGGLEGGAQPGGGNLTQM